jgi:hypothetical protein
VAIAGLATSFSTKAITHAARQRKQDHRKSRKPLSMRRKLSLNETKTA